MPGENVTMSIEALVVEYHEPEPDLESLMSEVRHMVSFKIDKDIVTILDHIGADFAAKGKTVTRSDLMRTAVTSFTWDLVKALEIDLKAIDYNKNKNEEAA